MFIGTALAGIENSSGFKPDGKHTVLVFLSGYSESYDWTKAERIASDHGWRDIEFSKAGRVSAEMIAAHDATMHASYRSAIDEGSAFLAYAEVLN